MKILVWTILFALPSFAFANICDSQYTEKMVTQAALSLEIINGGGRPLSTDVYSLSSQQHTWGIVFSYSGVQSLWTVKTSEDGCFVQGAFR